MVSGNCGGNAPADTIGGEGNFFFDEFNGNVWGPKTRGKWPTPPITPAYPGGTPGGSNGQIQYNNAGVFGGIDSTGTGNVIRASAVRTVLTADTTFYMRTDGNDSNTGTANTAGGAWLTLAGSLANLSRYDFGGYTVYLQIADGTYNDTYVNVPVMVGNKGPTGLVIQGNAADNTLVVLDGGAPSAGVGTIFASVPGACCTVKNLKMTTSVSAAAHLNAQSGGVIGFFNLVLGPTAANGSAVYVFGGGAYITNQDENLTYGGSDIEIGTANYVLNAQTGGVIALYGGTWNTTTANVLSYFAFASVGGIIDTGGCSFTTSGAGSYTGQRFICQNNGNINTYGSGPNYFPGTIAGTPAVSVPGSFS